jgi:A/G-specific adenine glycosylase
MDLGATICTPKSPTCLLCPWSQFCIAHAEGKETLYPKKAKKKPTPIRHGYAYVLRYGDNILVEDRPDKGLLGGILGLPTSDWGDKPQNHDAAPIPRNWQNAGEVRHVFTHFELRLEVFVAEIDEPIEGHWTDDVSGLPTVFRKVVSAALSV